MSEFEIREGGSRASDERWELVRRFPAGQQAFVWGLSDEELLGLFQALYGHFVARLRAEHYDPS